jgi:hypothetical protein
MMETSFFQNCRREATARAAIFALVSGNPDSQHQRSVREFKPPNTLIRPDQQIGLFEFSRFSAFRRAYAV